MYSKHVLACEWAQNIMRRANSYISYKPQTITFLLKQMWHICWMSSLVKTKHSAFLRQIMNTKVVQPLGGHSIKQYLHCLYDWMSKLPTTTSHLQSKGKSQSFDSSFCM